ncbi:unnamed protein product [Amoebophrya sp. A120]|nr:unnamed protein product [Amoebophrya sp. A120]|eukprot:GSA120T00016181001.1
MNISYAFERMKDKTFEDLIPLLNAFLSPNEYDTKTKFCFTFFSFSLTFIFLALGTPDSPQLLLRFSCFFSIRHQYIFIHRIHSISTRIPF